MREGVPFEENRFCSNGRVERKLLRYAMKTKERVGCLGIHVRRVWVECQRREFQSIGVEARRTVHNGVRVYHAVAARTVGLSLLSAPWQPARTQPQKSLPEG